MNRLIRCPSPDFTTACATRNAITTSSTLALAKPPNACAGEIVPVSTAAATASIVDVSSGNAPISTDAMAATNTANKCQAGAVRPAGTGVNQRPTTMTKGSAPRTSSRGRVTACASGAAGGACGCPMRTRPFRPDERPCTVPSSASSTYCHENS